MDWVALGNIALTGVVAGLPTWAFGRTLGRRIARTRPVTGLLLTLALMPAIGVATGAILFNIDVGAHPGSDWPAMQLLATLMLSAMSLAVTIPVAVATTRQRDDH